MRYSAPTKRGSMTKARATAIFLREDGICHICGNPIVAGEAWEVEHPDELADGGSDDDAVKKPAHVKCHKSKSAASRTARAKRNRIITQGCVSVPKSRNPMPGSRASGWKKTMQHGWVRR